MTSELSISSIEAIPVRIRREDAYLGALPDGVDPEGYFVRPPYRALYSTYFETALIKVVASDGTVGWGEALAPVAPEVVKTIVEQLLAPVLIGRDPLTGGVLWSVMYDLMRERGYYGGFMVDAISGCDTALWDLRGKILNQPVHVLLGGAYRDTVPCYVSGLPKPTDEERVDLALDWVTKGYHAFKLAAGYGVAEDTASLAALRTALGPDATLLLDAHWVYQLDEAVRLGRRLEEMDVAVFEAPLNPEDLAGHVALTKAVAVKIAVGETERTRYQFRPWLEARGADLYQPDVGRVGVSELFKIAQMAEAFNIPIAPHLSVGLGPCISASIHLAAAVPNLFMLEYQPPVFELANLFLARPLVCREGAYYLPTGPGLGIEIDEGKLAQLQK